ncbi:MAG TPA: branched-chain amino acid ABC transporter permease [Stellaceae bacterium]|jgi:branched-chain amino acid transport system permease protein|nr:branched-chain amino acid ABC transporter permease [Stellaceae bacterium]
MLDLLVNAIVTGLLLGGFYAAVTLGLSIAFGLLDIVNIAHPGFVMLGAFAAWFANADWGIDPMLAGFLFAPVFFLAGAAIFRIYHVSFERRGDAGLRGLAFFFGVLFLTEVALILLFGVDYRGVNMPYLETMVGYGAFMVPLRMVLPFLISLAMFAVLQVALDRTFLGRAIKAVSQDPLALRLMAADPVRVKEIAFGIAIATASVAGGLLITIAPVEPSMGRDYIGRVFAIAVLGGLGSITGTLLAAIGLGIAESITATFYGPSWAPAVAFGALLIALVVRPSGLLGR